jgi:hypothetical protein
MTQTDSPPVNITPEGFFYLFALPDSNHAQSADTVFYKVDGWDRVQGILGALRKLHPDERVVYACAPASVFQPSDQALLRRCVAAVEKQGALNSAGCVLPPGDPLFLRVQGFISARVMEDIIRRIPQSPDMYRHTFAEAVAGDPLNLLLNELHLYAERYYHMLKAVAGGAGSELDFELDTAYDAVVAMLTNILENCDDLHNAGITFTPLVSHIGPATLRKLDWDAVVMDAERFFTQVHRDVCARGMYEPLPDSDDAQSLVWLRVANAKALEQAVAYGRSIAGAKKTPDVSTATPQADLLATIKAGFEGVRDDRIKDALHGRTQQAEIEKMAESAIAFLAGLSVKLSAKDRELFFLLTGHVKQGSGHRVKTLDEIGRALKITRQAVQGRRQTLYKKYPAVAVYVKGIRERPGKHINFSELSPSERREMGVDESYN